MEAPPATLPTDERFMEKSQVEGIESNLADLAEKSHTSRFMEKSQVEGIERTLLDQANLLRHLRFMEKSQVEGIERCYLCSKRNVGKLLIHGEIQTRLLKRLNSASQKQQGLLHRKQVFWQVRRRRQVKSSLPTSSKPSLLIL